MSSKWVGIVRCYGLTQNPSNGSYMLIMDHMNIDLRKYLQQNHNQITWKERIQITLQIIQSLDKIRYENAIHRDLHSGNILRINAWRIGDLGFCGPVNKPSKSIYGNLPYVAPEVIVGKEYTFKSDIYSVGILMWEISSGQPPFINYKHDYYLAINIVNGIRPKIVSGTPLEYKNLMEQCWDADPSKRPDCTPLYFKMQEIIQIYHRDTSKNQNTIKKIFKKLNLLKSSQPKTSKNSETNKKSNLEIYYTSNLSTSKVYQFENLPEPRNATEGKLNYIYSNLFYIYLLLKLYEN